MVVPTGGIRFGGMAGGGPEVVDASILLASATGDKMGQAGFV